MRATWTSLRTLCRSAGEKSNVYNSLLSGLIQGPTKLCSFRSKRFFIQPATQVADSFDYSQNNQAVDFFEFQNVEKTEGDSVVNSISAAVQTATIKNLEESLKSTFSTSEPHQPLAVSTPPSLISRSSAVSLIHSRLDERRAQGPLSEEDFRHFIFEFAHTRAILAAVDLLVEMKGSGFVPDIGVYERLFVSVAPILKGLFMFHTFILGHTAPYERDNEIARVIRHLAGFAKRQKFVYSANFYKFIGRYYTVDSAQLENVMQVMNDHDYVCSSDLYTRLLGQKIKEELPLARLTSFIVNSPGMQPLSNLATSMYLKYVAKVGSFEDLRLELLRIIKERPISQYVIVQVLDHLTSNDRWKQAEEYVQFVQSLKVEDIRTEQHYLMYSELALYDPAKVSISAPLYLFLFSRALDRSYKNATAVLQMLRTFFTENSIEQSHYQSDILLLELRYALAYDTMNVSHISKQLCECDSPRSMNYYKGLLEVLYPEDAKSSKVPSSSMFTTRGIIHQLVTKDSLTMALFNEALTSPNFTKSIIENDSLEQAGTRISEADSMGECDSLETQANLEEGLGSAYLQEEMSEGGLPATSASPGATSLPSTEERLSAPYVFSQELVQLMSGHLDRLDATSRIIFTAIFQSQFVVNGRILVYFLRALAQQNEDDIFLELFTNALKLYSKDKIGGFSIFVHHHGLLRPRFANWALNHILRAHGGNQAMHAAIHNVGRLLLDHGVSLFEYTHLKLMAAFAGDSSAAHMLRQWSNLPASRIIGSGGAKGQNREKYRNGDRSGPLSSLSANSNISSEADARSTANFLANTSRTRRPQKGPSRQSEPRSSNMNRHSDSNVNEPHFTAHDT